MRKLLLLLGSLLFLTLAPLAPEASVPKPEPAAGTYVSELQHILLDLNRAYEFGKVRMELAKLEHSTLKEQVGDQLVLVSRVSKEEADFKKMKAEILQQYPHATVQEVSADKLEALRLKFKNDPR